MSLPDRLLHPLRYAWHLLQTTAREWLDDGCPQYGAALSYYAVFSMAPLLVILVALVGLFIGSGAAQQQLIGEISAMAGPKAGELAQSLLQAVSRPGEGTLASAIALTVLLVGATGVLVQLRTALDRIWLHRPQPQPQGQLLHTIWRTIRTRMLSLSILLVIGFLMLVSLAASAYLSVLDRWVAGQTSGMLELARVLNPLLSMAVLTFFFGILLAGLPSRPLGWRQILPGALLAAVLFTVGKSLIGLYIGSTSTTSVYGAAGALVALMIWVYFSSQILLFGAEFAWVLHMTPPGQLPGSPAYLQAAGQALRRYQHQLLEAEAAATDRQPAP